MCHVSLCALCVLICPFFPCMSANCLPACNWEDINIMRNVYQRGTKYRYRERIGCLIAWLLARPMVRVGLKLRRCPGCILILSLSLMIIKTQRFYTPLLPGNNIERCEQKWMPSYCSLKILIMNILCECVTVRRRRGHIWCPHTQVCWCMWGNCFSI